MANEQNLIPNSERTPKERKELARKGGIASGKARNERKAIQQMLCEYLEKSASKDPQLAKLAAKMGLKGDESIKYLFTVVCTLNTLKNGELKDLELMMKLLGETPTPKTPDTADETEDALSKALREEAERLNNADQ